LREAVELYNKGEYKEAFSLFLKNPKNSEAQFYLGMMYEHGDGVSCDVEKAKEWYRKASRQRNPDADFRLQSINQKTNCRC
jgi:TPR repeat protein